MGNIWAQHDAPPGGGDYRPERWPLAVCGAASDGDGPETSPVLGRFDAALLPGTPGGIYTATLILYEIGGVQSQPYTLGPLVIGRSTAPASVPVAFAPATLEIGDAALDLLGVRLSTTTLRPCETLTGGLFWEVEAPLRLPFQIRVRLGSQLVLMTPIASGGAQTLTGLMPGERFQSQFTLPISCRALDTTTPVEVSLVMPATAPGDPYEVFATWTGPEAEIAAGRAFTLGEAAVLGGVPEGSVVSLDTAFGTLTESGALSPLATLVGYSVAAPQGPTGPVLPAGKPFALVLYWRAERQTDVAYTVFVHATPPDTPGPVAAQHDGWPALGEKPTLHWVTDEIIADTHPMPALTPGTYALRAGLYGPDGARLETPEGDTAVVAIITVR